ncbi:hypothetical protein L1987_50691 [Smallanthus sonchifolius]|uniref:Uncharacterized protein n=1 Tax=Smallanthus sonchifolius TaxID=185202 RepID=A0ACB9EML2_9ASTR|nr:hypothetical protein L1987_50691 [Smallanthus sonchifolius]
MLRLLQFGDIYSAIDLLRLQLLPFLKITASMVVPVEEAIAALATFSLEVICFAKAGGHHVSGMAKAIELLEIPFENHLVLQALEVDHGIVIYLEKVGFLTSSLLAAHTV